MLILFVRCVCKICDKPILKSNMKLHAEDHCLTLEEYEGFYGPHHQHIKKGTEMYHECLVPGCDRIIFLDLVEVELHIKQEHKTITPASYIKNKMKIFVQYNLPDTLHTPPDCPHLAGFVGPFTFTLKNALSSLVYKQPSGCDSDSNLFWYINPNCLEAALH